MKRYSILLAIAGIALMGCSQEQKIEDEIEDLQNGTSQDETNSFLELHFGPSPGDG